MQMRRDKLPWFVGARIILVLSLALWLILWLIAG